MLKLCVWLVQIGEPLPIDAQVRKMRTAILAERLIKRGHKVLWWASGFDHFKKTWCFREDKEIEVGARFVIKVLKGLGYKKNFSFRRLIDHRIIAWKFKRFAPKVPRPDVILASMPSYDLAYEAVMFGNTNGVPVLVDVRDQWPDVIVQRVPRGLRWLARLVLFRDFLMVKSVMEKADGVVSMMGRLMEWGLNIAARSKCENDKVFYLGATRTSKTPSIPDKYRGLLENCKDKYVVTFIGSFIYHNNPLVVIEAARKISKRRVANDLFFLLGGCGDLFEEAFNLAAGLSNLYLTGWLNREEIEALLSFSKIGIIPSSIAHYAFPNKAFTYLSAGIPIISSALGELEDIIERHRIGINVPPGDDDSLAEAILKLYFDKRLYNEMARNAKKVFDNLFDADRIYEEFARHIERVVDREIMKVRGRGEKTSLER